MILTLNEALTPLSLPMVAQSLDYTCGAACFASMFQYYYGYSYGELYFANELDTMRIGYTPPEHIIALAKWYGLQGEMKINAKVTDFITPLARNEVIFVTWWDEDAGHYSLVKHLSNNQITLMDPWLARSHLDNTLPLNDFIAHWQLRHSRMIKIYR